MKKILKRFVALRMVREYNRREKTIDDLEKRHADKSYSGFSDALYFAGVTENSFSLVTRMAFRSDLPNESWLKISIPEEGIWGFEHLTHEEISDEEGESYRFVQGGLRFECTEPGELWNLKYDGPVFQGKKSLQLHLDLYWHSLVPIADFDKVGTSYDTIAFRMADEKWNRDFFKKIREMDNVHYEQAGNITGTVRWKRKKYEVQLNGLRGHSYGKRRWEDWGRNIWLSGMLQDGRYFHISIVDYSFVKNLKAGFIWNRKEFVTLESIPSFGELKLVEPMPKSLSFKIAMPGNEKPVPVRVDMKVFFPVMMDGVYYIRQAQATFDVGGIKGTGIAEMGINVKTYNISFNDLLTR